MAAFQIQTDNSKIRSKITAHRSPGEDYLIQSIKKSGKSGVFLQNPPFRHNSADDKQKQRERGEGDEPSASRTRRSRRSGNRGAGGERGVLTQDEGGVAKDGELEIIVGGGGGEQLALGLPECLRRAVGADCQLIEPLHEVRRGFIGDWPQGDDNFARPSKREGPTETKQAFSGNGGTGPGLAGGQGDQPGMLEWKPGDFRRKQQIIVVGQTRAIGLAGGPLVEHESTGEEQIRTLVEIDGHPERGIVVLKEKGVATEMEHRR